MNSHLTILHTIGSLKQSKGGPSRTVSSLCEALGIAGATVHLLAQEWPSADTNITPDKAYVTTHLIPAMYCSSLRIPLRLSYRKTIVELCRKSSVGIIHDHGLWLPCNHSAATTARRLNLPMIIQPRGMLEPGALSFRAWKKQLAWKLYQKQDLESASLLVATSEQEAASIRKVGFRQPIAIIPNGIDLPEWKERSLTKDGPKTALFLSRIHPIKGLMNLVAAWDRVRPEGWQMVIAGPDEDNHLGEVEIAVRRAGLEKEFKFVGPVEGDAKEKLYRNADLFILPTHSENFGVVVAEALAYGVPVITTKGAPWEGLVTYDCGWWIDIGMEPLAKAIRAATSMSSEERQANGQRGRAYVEQKFAWPKIAEQMLSVYEWVLKMRSKPSVITDF